jgi:polysaccharide deacetylase family protein (PEP-CTERM system associated)
MKSILTFDIEEARHMHIGGRDLKPSPEDFRRGLFTLLDLLKKYNAKATFFVVAEIGSLQPDLVRRIADDGHEIAHHSLKHKHLLEMTSEEFEKDLIEGKKVLEEVSGGKVVGYRAPSWSAHTKKTPWLWEILKKNGFEYSSSLFPLWTPLYGDLSSPTGPHLRDGILEIPAVPFAGGFYFRILPDFVRKVCEKVWRKRELPIMYYFHLRDLGLEKIHPSLSLTARSVNYWGSSFARKRFEKILKKSVFVSLGESMPNLIKSKKTE